MKETVDQWKDARVAFVGSPAQDELPDGFERVSPESEADVYHVRHDRLESVRDLRAQYPNAAVVVDLTGVSANGLDRRALALARGADVVAVASASEARSLEQRDQRFDGRTYVLPASIDLARFAPDADLAATRRVLYSRFKRYHRLAPPTVLYAGAYVPDGGLALALDAVYLLREELTDIRFTAIPLGRIDQRHLDKCERRALVLGHRGVVQWSTAEDELPFWFATASVVLVAGDEAARPALLAAAAARPVVALDAAAAAELDRTPASDSDALAASIRALLGPAGIAEGEENRKALVARQEGTGLRLAQLWSSAAFGAGALSSATLRAVRADATSVPSSSTVIQPR